MELSGVWFSVFDFFQSHFGSSWIKQAVRKPPAASKQALFTSSGMPRQSHIIWYAKTITSGILEFLPLMVQVCVRYVLAELLWPPPGGFLGVGYVTVAASSGDFYVLAMLVWPLFRQDLMCWLC